MPFIPYVLLCIIAGLLARDTRPGFWGGVIISFFLTPIPVFLAIFFFVPKDRPHHSAA